MDGLLLNLGVSLKHGPIYHDIAHNDRSEASTHLLASERTKDVGFVGQLWFSASWASHDISIGSNSFNSLWPYGITELGQHWFK